MPPFLFSIVFKFSFQQIPRQISQNSCFMKERSVISQVIDWAVPQVKFQTVGIWNEVTKGRAFIHLSQANVCIWVPGLGCGDPLTYLIYRHLCHGPVAVTRVFNAFWGSIFFSFCWSRSTQASQKTFAIYANPSGGFGYSQLLQRCFCLDIRQVYKHLSESMEIKGLVHSPAWNGLCH